MKTYHADLELRELWLLHREEEMEAARQEFQRGWRAHRKELLDAGVSFWNLACEEQRAWDKFRKAKGLTNNHEK